MGKKNNTPVKEIYRLWWEYWKRTNQYNQTMAFIKKQRITDPKSFEDSLRSILMKKFSQLDFSHKGDITDKLLRDGIFTFMFELCVYDRQGICFEDAWEKKGTKPRFYRLDNKWVVTDYLEWYEMDFDSILREFRAQNERNPSYEEFKESFKRRLMSYGERFVFSVHETDLFSIQRIGKEFIQLLRKKRNDPEFLKEKNRPWLEGFFAFLPEKARYKDLKRYLQIYKLHEEEGKKYREIAGFVYPKKQFEEDLRVVLVKEKKKAKRIINNVERGIFPGEYN
jgi:hypothetical protein